MFPWCNANEGSPSESQRRQTPRHAPPVATDSRLVRRWRLLWAPALSLSPRTRARGGRRDDWNSSDSQILTEFRPAPLRRRKKKAPRPGRSALIFRILFGEVLLPFFRGLLLVLLRLLLHSNLLLRLSRCRASPPITRRSFHIRAVFVGVKGFRRPK